MVNVLTLTEALMKYPVHTSLTEQDFERIHEIFSNDNNGLLRRVIYATTYTYRGNTPVQLANMRNIIYQDFKNPEVQLALLFHVLQHSCVYPVSLISHITKNEEALSRELVCLLNEDPQARLEVLFSKFSQEGYYDNMYDLSKSFRNGIDYFVVENLVLSWLFADDPLITFSETLERGLNLNKIEDDLLDKYRLGDADRRVFKYALELIIYLEEYVVNFMKVSRNTQSSWEMYFDSAKSKSIPGSDGILHVLKSVEFEQKHQRLMNLTTLEAVAYLDFCWKINRSDSRDTRRSESSDAVCSFIEFFGFNAGNVDYYADSITMNDSQHVSEEQLEKIVNSFETYVPEAFGNSSVKKLALFIANEFLRQGYLRPSIQAGFEMLILASFPRHHSFDLGNMKEKLKKANAGEMRIGGEKFYGLSLDKISLMLEWVEYFENSDTEIPLFLYFAINEDYSISQHIKECEKWIESLEEAIN